MNPSPDDDEVPECGTAVALTYFMVAYVHQGTIHMNEGTFCCGRHIPRPNDALPEDAQIMEVLIADSRMMTIVQDGEARVTVNTSGSLLNVSDPKAWTAYDSEPAFFPAELSALQAR